MQYSSQKAHTQRGNYGTREDSAVFKCHPTWSKHGAWSELCCCRDLGETRLLTFNALYQSALQHWTGSGFPALFSLIKIHQSDFFFLSFIHFEYVQLYHVEDYKEKQVSLKLRSLNLWEFTGKFVKKKKRFQWPQLPHASVVISRAVQTVIDHGYFWTPALSSSEHTPTQLSFSKWCQDGQDPTDVVHTHRGGTETRDDCFGIWKRGMCVITSESNSDAESSSIMCCWDWKYYEDLHDKCPYKHSKSCVNRHEAQNL